MIQTEEQFYLPVKHYIEILETQYCKVAVELLHSDNAIREVHLCDEKNIAKTYAISIRNKECCGNETIEKIDELVNNGAPIKKADHNILNSVTEIYVTNLAEWLMLAFENEDKIIKTRMTEFLVKKNENVFEYEIITEVYSPHFRKNKADNKGKAQINIAVQVLKILGYINEEIWMSIKEEQGSYCNEQYTSFIAGVREKVNVIIKDIAPLMSLH